MSKIKMDSIERGMVYEAAFDLTQICNGLSKQAGWWSDVHTGKPVQPNVPEKLMLVVSELSEAMEAHRKSLRDDKLPDRPGIEVEIADAIIRLFDLSGGLGLDVPGALVDKLVYNLNREDHKIENRRKPGGKAF